MRERIKRQRDRFKRRETGGERERRERESGKRNRGT